MFNESFEYACEEALNELIKEVSFNENVDEDVALYLIYKNLDIDVGVINDQSMMLTTKLKSIEDLLQNVEDNSEWEKEMHKKLLNGG